MGIFAKELRYLHLHAYCSTVHMSEDLEAAWMAFNKMDFKMHHTYTKVVSSIIKNEINETCRKKRKGLEPITVNEISQSRNATTLHFPPDTESEWNKKYNMALSRKSLCGRRQVTKGY